MPYLVRVTALIGATMTGISRYLFQNGMLEQNDPNLQVHLQVLRQRANEALAQFEPAVQRLGVNSYEKRMMDDEASGGISLAALYSDLVVIGQADPDQPLPSTMPDFSEYVVMNAGRPVLIVPYAGTFDSIAEHVLIAWDASMEATRAVTASIPLLQRAKAVDVVVFNPSSRPDAHDEQP